MVQPKFSDFKTWVGKPLGKSEWDFNLNTIIGFLTGAWDLTIGALTAASGYISGALTVDGKITTTAGFYGDGANITGIGGSGAATSVGIAQIEQLTETSKLFRAKIPTSITFAISEPLIGGENWTGTIAAAPVGATALTIQPAVVGQEPPKLLELTVCATSTGTVESVFITGGILSGTSGSYTISSGLQNGFANGSNLYRNFCSVNIANSDVGILSGQAGNSRYIQTHRGGQADVGSRSGAVVDWSVRLNSATQGLRVNSVIASPTNTINVLMTTDRTGEFSTTSPYNKIILCKVTEDGQKNVYQIGKGKEFTITGVGAFSSTYAPITVSDTYNDMDSGNTAAIGGVTAAGITELSSDGLTYWVVQVKTAIPNLSFVPTATNESFIEVTPKKATIFNQGTAIPTYVHSIWKLNGNILNFKNTSGTYNLAMTGTVPYLAGKPNFGLCAGPYTTSNYFKWDAGGSSATVFDSAIFAFEAFIYLTQLGVDGVIAGKYNGDLGQGWTFQIGTNNKLNFRFDGTSKEAATALSINTWYHVAAFHIGTGAGEHLVYVNGVNDLTTTAGAFTATTQSFIIGVTPIVSGVPANPFKGYIQSAAYWSTVPATAAECLAFATLRASGGGKEYGTQFGMSISGTESNKTGQLVSFKTDIVQPSLTATLPTIESKNLIVTGGA